MSNDRNDDNFDHEESEYHFSDDDSGFEIEPESTKPSDAAAAPAATSENLLTRLTRSRRMLISVGVFLVLVFVAYKLVAPATSTTPSTDIAAANAQTNAAQQQVQPAPMVAQTQPVVQQQVQMQPQVQPVQMQPQQMQQPVAMQQQPVQPVAQAAPTGLPPQTSVVPQNLPPQTAVVTQQVQQAPVQYQPVVQQPVQQQPAQVATTVPVQTLPQPTQVVPTAPVAQQQPSDLTANADQAMQQMQADYQAKMSSYAVQNKAILDQLQALSAKVAAIQNQMNQLTQNIARPNPVVGPSSNAAPIAPAPSDESTPQVSYNVQAIIPGRAWLKSENGETVTVAEGDVVRDLGRIAKIDPYDGIVEINTGSKMLTLSYGNMS